MKITGYNPDFSFNLTAGSIFGNAGGDLSGLYPGPLVTGIWGVSIASNTAPVTGQVLTALSPTLIGWATSSNSVAFGSNATRVSANASGGSSGSNARADHIHDGIGTITASSSNTLDRGTFNLRAGSNVSFALSDSDGSGGFDTVTVNASATGGGSGVTSIAKSGSTGLTGAVTLTGGTNVTLTQSGNDISIASTGGGGTTLPGSVDGLYQWFKADAITGKINGDSLTEWRNSRDLPGGDLIVATGSPTYQTNVLNSLPVVRLGGATYLKGMGLALVAPAFTVFVVCKFSSLANAYTGIIGWDVSGDHGGWFAKSNGLTAVYPLGGSNYDGTGAITLGTTNWNYLRLHVKGSTYDTYRNAVADKTAVGFTWSYSTAPNATYYLGNQFNGGRIMSGDIAEVLIYNRGLSSTEVTSVETYITGKYAL